MYKVKCFGVPVKGPVEIFCDNVSVVHNLSILASSLNKSHNTIYYHRVREAQDSGIIRVGCIPGDFNPSDLFTKTKIPGNKRHNLVHSIFSNTSSPISDIQKA